MKTADTLIGKKVKLFIEGGYELEGIVESLDKEKVIINDNDNIFLIFKEKVFMILISSRDILLDEKDPEKKPQYNIKRPEDQAKQGHLNDDKLVAVVKSEKDIAIEKEKDAFAANGIAEQNQYGAILPSTLIQQQPKDPYIEALDSDIENSFSVNSSVLYNEDALLDRMERQKIIEKNKRELDDSSQ